MPDGMKLFGLLFCTLAFLSHVECFKAGAPTTMCADMMPHHAGASPQTTPPNYRISVDPLDERNGIFKVKINSNREPFAGFLLEARASPDGEPMGTFSKHSEDSKTINCGKTPNVSNL